MPTNDAQVGEEHTEAIEARDTKQKQVAGDDGQFREADGAEVLLLAVVAGLFVDEEDAQVALHHRAVLKTLKLIDVVSEVDIRATDCNTQKKIFTVFFIEKQRKRTTEEYYSTYASYTQFQQCSMGNTAWRLCMPKDFHVSNLLET